MNITEIVQQLRMERDKLDAAIGALEGVGVRGSSLGRRRGRPPGIPNKGVAGVSTRRRGMSAGARKRIAEAMRRRWALAKRSGKKRL